MNKAYFTFLQYATRKTGLGRTHWFFAILIHIGFILFCTGGIYWLVDERDPLMWIVIAIPVLGSVGFWVFTYGNYRTDKAREEAGPSNKHRGDV